ncbi:putative short-chain dehydrogenase [Cladochytrium replicatum]|nr:putative short-chain dehydrogenase [Cladochytrium replicatum]KAI8803747.1 putative short-chain dehydrogenase [Cladochytrium replicatum]
MTADSLSLAGKIAFVTGSSRENGIGGATAKALARNGAAVAIHCSSEDSRRRAEQVASALSKEFGVRTTVVVGKVQSFDDAKVMIEQILKSFGASHIDILVNNQAAAGVTPLLEATPEQLTNEFTVNVFSVIYLVQAVVRVGKMPKGGRIINIGSAASKLLVPSLIYTICKAAQDAVTTLLAGELGPSHNITINSVGPGPTPTEMSKPYLVEADGSASALQTGLILQTRAGGRLGTAADVADAVVLLASKQSQWITGQWIGVNGGLTGAV